jgi:hypothetical protein
LLRNGYRRGQAECVERSLNEGIANTMHGSVTGKHSDEQEI